MSNDGFTGSSWLLITKDLPSEVISQLFLKFCFSRYKPFQGPTKIKAFQFYYLYTVYPFVGIKV